jgi:hypothetical protein
MGKYFGNPKRGCGTKKKDAFYLEGGELSRQGELWAGTWFLGSGLFDDLDTARGCNITIPPRQMGVYNLPATIANGQLEIATGKFVPVDQENVNVYNRLRGQKRLKRIGIFDHVGTSHYSPWSFADEIMQLGPSRRVTPEFALFVAALIRRIGPVPVLFTHSKMPVFEASEDRDAAIRSLGIDTEILHLDPTWMRVKFGMYSDMYNGHRSYLIPVLKELALGTSVPMGIQFCEQPFVASWYTRVTYTLPDDGMIDDKIQEMYEQGLINVLNLDELEEVEESE